MSKVLKNIVLVGSPNSGKTTLYNWLTASHYKTVNYPGATVDYAKGYLKIKGESQSQYQIIDTPGIYSLNSTTDDEIVTRKILTENVNLKPDLMLIVIDSTQIERQIPLLDELLKLNVATFLVLSMADIIENKNGTLDLTGLSVRYPGLKIFQFDGLLGKGLNELNTALIYSFDEKTSIGQNSFQINQAKKIDVSKIDYLATTLKIDRWALHPILGYLFFFVIMTGLFSSVYWLATPFMDAIEFVFSHISQAIKTLVPGLVGDFLTDGVIAAIAGVIVFVPQIFILFFGIGLLESTGYLARVAALINSPFEKIGLGGRSFVPMLSGFACAIPAIMATRNIPNKKEKLLAQLVIPFMSCSARLPVFGLLLGFIFLGKNPILPGMVMTFLYFLSVFIGVVASLVLSKILTRSGRMVDQKSLALELPQYRKPRALIIFRSSIDKVLSFVKRAGPVIFSLALVLWFATNFPKPEAAQQESSALTSSVVANSYASQMGRAIEPIFTPMGLDWRAGFGLISAFAAREVFVSALALIFNIEGEEDSQIDGLMNTMSQAKFQSGALEGRFIFSIASCSGLLVFFLVALQCISTVGVLKKETGSMKIALFHLIFSNIAAYVLAVVVYQSLSYVGLG